MKEKLSGGKRTAEGMSSPEKPSAVRVAAIGKTGGAPARKVAHLTPEERARGEGGPQRGSAVQPRPVGAGQRPAGSGGAVGGARRRAGCRSWCRSVTAGCWCRRSRSTGGPR